LLHFVCVCVGEIISLPWFSKELKYDLSKNNCLCGVILILLVRESIFVGWGSLFSIVLVPRYKLSLCHTPIKPNLLGFPRIGVFACGLCDHVITRFASTQIFQNGLIVMDDLLKWENTKILLNGFIVMDNLPRWKIQRFFKMVSL
jgi:hypothetical protein